MDYKQAIEIYRQNNVTTDVFGYYMTLLIAILFQIAKYSHNMKSTDVIPFIGRTISSVATVYCVYKRQFVIP